MALTGEFTQSTELKDWMASLVGSAPFGTLAFDLEGLCVVANGAAASFFGVSASDLVDRSAHEVFGDCPEVLTHLRARHRAQSEFDVPEQPIASRIARVRGRGILDGFLITLDDVTAEVTARQEQERLVTRLERVNRELEQFAYVSAHDMKAPITNIVGLVEQLQSEPCLDAGALEVAGMIQSSSSILLSTCRALEQVLQMGQSLESASGTACVRDELQSVLAAIPLPDRLSVRIDAEPSAGRWTDEAEADLRYPMTPAHLRSVLQNLITNAIKHLSLDRPGEITVRVRTGGPHAVLAIQDNGVGFDCERHGDRIFELFRQLDRTGAGSGVGLYLVRSIARGYGGVVTATSQPEQGACFTVSVPGVEHDT